MTLAAGTRLGRYEILSPLGAGGMGEVYRARDLTLERDVAVKVLPARLSDDPEASARFAREAKSVAALSHPNILGIFEFGEAGGITFAVTELLEGVTLRERLASGPLSPRKTIEYGIQIAHGLAAAHEKGIVHRDLKPENLFITKDGRAKILDFGLARLRTGVQAGDDANSPTISADTHPGTVLGTVGYMSPEQVRGESADHRSDIFSFGVVLYEMLSGRRAFRGDTSVETMHAILKEEPAPIEEASQIHGPPLERILRHCLEKHLEERFRSAHDLAFALETLTSGSGSSQSRIGQPARGPSRQAVRLLAVALLVAAGVLAGALVTRRFVRSHHLSFTRLTFARGVITAARFSPSSGTVVYSARWQNDALAIFSVLPGNPESRPLGLTDASIMSVSPSEELAIQRDPHQWAGSESGTLCRVPLGGGGVRDVMEFVQEAAWSADGSQLAILRMDNSRHRIEFPPGNLLYETSRTIRNLRMSRKGGLLSFCESLGRQWGAVEICVIDRAKTKTVVARSERCSGNAWGASSEGVWFSEYDPSGQTSFWVATLSGRRRLVGTAPGLLELQDVSSDGRLLALMSQAQDVIHCRAPGESQEADFSWLDGSQAVDLSSDGSTLLFQEAGAGAGNADGTFYIRKTNGTPAVRLGTGDPQALSADGRYVLAFMGDPPGQLVMVPTGAGEQKSIRLGEIEQSVASWFFPNGEQVLFSGRSDSVPDRFYVCDVAGGPPRPVTPEGVLNFSREKPLSPDGERIAGYVQSQSAVRVGIYPVDGGESKPVVGLETGDVVIRWASDSQHLFVFNRDKLPARVYRLDPTTGQKALWKEFMPLDPAGVRRISSIILTPDGDAYAYNFTRKLSALYLIDLDKSP